MFVVLALVNHWKRSHFNVEKRKAGINPSILYIGSPALDLFHCD